MMNPELSCGEEHRRDEVRAASLFGLDYAEVDETQRTVTVYFLGKAPQGITKANIAITGGTRTKDVRVVNLRVQHQTDPTLDEYMEVSVNQPGDFSSYTLRVVQLDERGNPTSTPFPGLDRK